MSELIKVQYSPNTATVVMNRPDQMNAMNLEMINELIERLEEVKKSDVNLVLLTGEGRAFSAGGDIKMMLDEDPSNFETVMDAIKKLVKLFYTMPKITISVVNGAAAGLGLSLALAADYILAQKDAKVAMNFIGIGLIPDGGGHFFMEQRLGTFKAKQTIWEGEVMLASDAFNIGLIDLAAENVNEAVELYTKRLSQAPLLAMLETKKIYNSQTEEKLDAYLERETKGQLSMRQTEDHKEGIRAFLDKRKPEFKGK